MESTEKCPWVKQMACCWEMHQQILESASRCAPELCLAADLSTQSFLSIKALEHLSRAFCFFSFAQIVQRSLTTLPQCLWRISLVLSFLKVLKLSARFWEPAWSLSVQLTCDFTALQWPPLTHPNTIWRRCTWFPYLLMIKEGEKAVSQNRWSSKVNGEKSCCSFLKTYCSASDRRN